MLRSSIARKDCTMLHQLGCDSHELTISPLMSYIYIYMELPVKPEMLTAYIYGPTFDNAKSRLFLFAVKRFNTESMQKFILWHSCV
jgi:hypothetical protein